MKKQYFHLAAFYAVLLAGVATGFIDPITASAGGMLGLVVSVKSTVITNADATPSVINKAFLARAREHIARGVVTCANGDSINSVYRFARIKSNDLVTMVMVDNATWGAGCTADIGLYDVNGGAVVSQALFASAIDMAAVNRALDATRESGTITVANMEKRVWELLALTADPQKEYDVAFTLTAAAAAAGSACGQIRLVAAGG